MATSPTVLAGAPSTPTPNSPPVEAKFPIVPLLIAVIVGVLIAGLSIGGITYYFIRSGRLPVQNAVSSKAERAVPVTTHAMVLEPLLVNLADSGGNAYLRVALTLRVADVVDIKAPKTKEEKADDKGGNDEMAPIRDTALTVLGQQTADGLLALDGKERLKKVLKAAFAEHNTNLKVTDIFFTDFLVQQ